ncbi:MULTISPECIES: hypothetical protein [unclassified Pseudomonas]|nr:MULTISPECIES: hypothetical protein [unclassified Pseudomonas]
MPEILEMIGAMNKAYVCARRSGSNILLKACLILHGAMGHDGSTRVKLA